MPVSIGPWGFHVPWPRSRRLVLIVRPPPSSFSLSLSSFALSSWLLTLSFVFTSSCLFFASSSVSFASSSWSFASFRSPSFRSLLAVIGPLSLRLDPHCWVRSTVAGYFVVGFDPLWWSSTRGCCGDSPAFVLQSPSLGGICIQPMRAGIPGLRYPLAHIGVVGLGKWWGGVVVSSSSQLRPPPCSFLASRPPPARHSSPHRYLPRSRVLITVVGS